MADKYQTQCPHCGVKFQLTAQQLAAANGAVRCGACLQVFQANQHLVPIGMTPPPPGVGSARATPPPPPPAAKPAAAIPPRPVAPPPIEDDLASDDDLADMILRELDENPLPTPATGQAPLPLEAEDAESANAAPASVLGTLPEPPGSATRSSPAPAMQWTLPASDEGKPRMTIGGELDDALLSNDDPFGAAASGRHADATHGNTAAADESWAKALLGEGTDEKEDRISKFIGVTADKLSLAEGEKKSGLAGRLDDIERFGGGTPAPAAGKRAESVLDDELDFLGGDGLTLHDVELPSLDADAGLAHGGSHDVAWNSNIFWGALSAVFMLLLAAQSLIFNFDTLARDDNWRAFYAGACDALGCTLPAPSDVSRIQGANLVVRSHPTVPNALVVDAIIYNRAPFSQPFPDLELSFSDNAGNVVAGRVFKPTEYLTGDLADNDAMPPDTPVHLSIELVDPGPRASGYALRFLPPATS